MLNYRLVKTLTRDELKDIRHRVENGDPLKRIAADYNVCIYGLGLRLTVLDILLAD